MIGEGGVPKKPGRPKGAKDVKPRTRRCVLLFLMSEVLLALLHHDVLPPAPQHTFPPARQHQLLALPHAGSWGCSRVGMVGAAPHPAVGLALCPTRGGGDVLKLTWHVKFVKFGAGESPGEANWWTGP